MVGNQKEGGAVTLDNRDVNEERWRRTVNRPPRCWTTWKLSFRTEAAATKHADRVTAKHGVRVEPYLCDCRRWHLRNAAKAEMRANQRAERKKASEQ
jgi:hypothetical protein